MTPLLKLMLTARTTLHHGINASGATVLLTSGTLIVCSLRNNVNQTVTYHNPNSIHHRKRIVCKSDIKFLSNTKFTSRGSGGTAPYTHTWSLNGIQITNTNYIIPTTIGTYLSTVTDVNGCRSLCWFRLI